MNPSKLSRLLAIFACVPLAIFSQPAIAAPGDLDFTFGGTGKVTTPIGSGDDQCYGIAVQQDGRIVVAGYSWNGSNEDFALVRYNADGSLDSNFSSTGTVGKVTTDFGGSGDVGYCVAIQSDGKIIVAGSSSIAGSSEDFALARYNTDGTLDTTFNGTGKVTTAIGGGIDYARSIAIQSDGKIVAAGISDNGTNYDFAVVRYNANGSLDTTFNGTGKVTTSISTGSDYANSVAIQSDHKIVIAGYCPGIGGSDFAVVRYDADGSLDTSFNGTGKVTTDFEGDSDEIHSVTILNDGKIVAGGTTFSLTSSVTTDFALVRYNTDGSLDTSFNGTGKVTTDFHGGYDYGYGVAVQDNGRIVFGGAAFSNTSNLNLDFALVRYNADGSLDTTFNGTGKVTTAIGAGYDHAFSLAVQHDGSIVLAGNSFNGSNSDFAVVRYEGDVDTDGDGIPDLYETGTGIYVSPQNTGTSPTNPDTDDDGLNDGAEVYRYHSNPFVKDTDGDGFDDGFEAATGFSPTSPSSTPDAQSSIRAAAEYRFNAANGISYRIEASTDLANWQTIETDIVGAGGVITRFYSIEGQPKRFFRSRRN